MRRRPPRVPREAPRIWPILLKSVAEGLDVGWGVTEGDGRGV